MWTHDNTPIIYNPLINYAQNSKDSMIYNNSSNTNKTNFGESIFIPQSFPLEFKPLNFQIDISKDFKQPTQKFYTNFLDMRSNNLINSQLGFLNIGYNFNNFNNFNSFNSFNILGSKSSKTNDVDVKKEQKYNNTNKAVNTSSWKNFVKAYGVTEKTINGSKVYACRWSSFSKSQPEWIKLQKHMIGAAEDLGLTLVYSDMDRSVSASNAARKKKGNIVAEGGKSPHNYGTACDICLFKDGVAVSTKSPLFRQFAELAKQKSGNRIAWGGDWNKPNEEHHFELRDLKKYKKDQYKIV